MAVSEHEEPVADEAAAARLREATEALEAVVRDRTLLRQLDVEERTRLLTAAGAVFNPDVVTRRALGQGDPPPREERAHAPRPGGARRDRDPRPPREAGVHDAERLPAARPEDFVARATKSASARRSRSSTATSASSRTASCTRSTTSSASPCGDFNFAKRTETADLRGRVALLTGGRVKIGYQAGIKLLRAGAAADRHDPVPARRRRALRDGGGLRGLERPARGPRARPAAHAERRGLLRAPARDARPARLHRQQRVPDRAPAAGLLPAHARQRDRGRAGAARPRPRRSSAGTRASRGVELVAGATALADPAPAELSQVPLLPEDAPPARPLPGGPPRPGPAAGRPARRGTRGASCSRRSRPSSCSRRSS